MVAVVAACLVLASCADSDPPDAATATTAAGLEDPQGAARPDADEIVYLEAGWLPEGWTVGHATERVGPPVDYTLVWRPAVDAGADRSASTGDDTGPIVYANVGAAAYHGPQTYEALAALDLESAQVVEDDGALSLDFHLGCCLVALGARGVDAETLRRIAEDIGTVDRERWADDLGARLLVDGG
jgi:hypothetical protein